MSPPTLRTSYIFIITAKADVIGSFALAQSTFPQAAPIQIFALVLLFTLSVIYAHVLWLLEKSHNVAIDTAYGPGVFDAWWLALATSVRPTNVGKICIRVYINGWRLPPREELEICIRVYIYVRICGAVAYCP
jgi:hypothetical protein